MNQEQDNTNINRRFTINAYHGSYDNLNVHQNELNDDSYDDSDINDEEYQYPNFNQIYTNMNETQCHICREIVSSYDYDDHIATHLRELSHTALNSLHQNVVQPLSSIPSIFSLFGLSNSTDSPFASSVVSLESNNITNNTNLNGVPFASLFENSFQLVSNNLTFRGFAYTLLDDDRYDDYEANLRLADVIGKVEVGVSDIETVSKVISKDSLETDVICPICMDKIKTLKDECRELVCTHKYCDPCISKWLSTNKRCPVCNVDVEEKYAQTSI